MFTLLLLLLFVTASFGFQPRHVAISVQHRQQLRGEVRTFSFSSSHQHPKILVINRGTKLYATASSEINVIAHSSTAESPPKFTLNLANQLTISRICAIPFFMFALVMRKVHTHEDNND